MFGFRSELFADVTCVNLEVRGFHSAGHLLCSGLPWKLGALGELVKQNRVKACFFSLGFPLYFLGHL